jgi:hypothetical protein
MWTTIYYENIYHSEEWFYQLATTGTKTAHNVAFCRCSNKREKAEALDRNVVRTDAETKKVLPGSCWLLNAKKIIRLNQHTLPLPHTEQHADNFEHLGPIYSKASVLTLYPFVVSDIDTSWRMEIIFQHRQRCGRSKRAHTLAILTLWCIWKQRNAVVFSDPRRPVQALFVEIQDTCTCGHLQEGRLLPKPVVH